MPSTLRSARFAWYQKTPTPMGYGLMPQRSKTSTPYSTRLPIASMPGRYGGCGTFMLAEASAAVPFVGAAIGAVTIAQLLRVASMNSTPSIMQVDSLMPRQAASAGRLNPAATQGLGGIDSAWHSRVPGTQTAAMRIRPSFRLGVNVLPHRRLSAECRQAHLCRTGRLCLLRADPARTGPGGYACYSAHSRRSINRRFPPN